MVPQRVCSSQVTPGFGSFSKGHSHSGAGACHQKGPHPRGHGRTQPGAFPPPSTIPVPFPNLLCPALQSFPWDLVQWWLCPLSHLRVSTPHGAAPRKAKPVWKTHPESENPLGPMAGTNVTAVQVAPGKRPPPCPHPRDSPVGVEEDVDEHGSDGGQRVGGHRQDTEAGLGALHRVQHGAGGWQGNGRASGLGTARGQSRSATPWPPRPQPAVSQGAEGWPGGPKGCGYHCWELEHLGGDRVALGVPRRASPVRTAAFGGVSQIPKYHWWEHEHLGRDLGSPGWPWGSPSMWVPLVETGSSR